MIRPRDFASLLRPRPRDAHKGTCGHLLIAGGSVNRLGAPLLTARAALRTGAGLVTLALPKNCYAKIPRGLLEVMYEPLAGGDRFGAAALRPLLRLAAGKDAVAIGPGIGKTTAVRKIVLAIIRLKIPVVLDADGLNVLEGVKGWRGSRLVLTPHPAELSRLLGTTTARIQADRKRHALTAARRFRAIVVLKGYRTIVATPEGRTFVNPTGNPGMATAGMGDLLTGMIGALVAANPDFILRAVLAAVYLHGLAGDRVAKRLGDRGLTASDVIEEIPHAFRQLVGR